MSLPRNGLGEWQLAESYRETLSWRVTRPSDHAQEDRRRATDGIQSQQPANQTALRDWTARQYEIRQRVAFRPSRRLQAPIGQYDRVVTRPAPLPVLFLEAIVGSRCGFVESGCDGHDSIEFKMAQDDGRCYGGAEAHWADISEENSRGIRVEVE